MEQAASGQTRAKGKSKWTKVKVATVVAILVLSSLTVLFFWMAWDYRGAKNRAQHTIMIDMANCLGTATTRIYYTLNDSSNEEGRSAEASWAYQMLDRLHWDALAVGEMFLDSSSTHKTFFTLATAFDELKMAVIQAQSQILDNGDVEASLNSGLESAMNDTNLLYQEFNEAASESSSWSNYPPSTVKYIDLGYVKDLALDIIASV